MELNDIKDKELSTFLKENKGEFEVSGGKIVCKISKHEFSLKKGEEFTKNEFFKYINGNKYKLIKKRVQVDISKHTFLIPHKTKSKVYYCIACKSDVNQVPEEIENHVNGKRCTRKRELYDKRLEEKKLKKGGKKIKGEDGEELDPVLARMEGLVSEEEDEEEETGDASSDNGEGDEFMEKKKKAVKRKIEREEEIDYGFDFEVIAENENENGNKKRKVEEDEEEDEQKESINEEEVKAIAERQKIKNKKNRERIRRIVNKKKANK